MSAAGDIATGCSSSLSVNAQDFWWYFCDFFVLKIEKKAPDTEDNLENSEGYNV